MNTGKPLVFLAINGREPYIPNLNHLRPISDCSDQNHLRREERYVREEEGRGGAACSLHESKEGETRALHVKANRPQVYGGGKEEANDRGSDVLVEGRKGGKCLLLV